MRKRKEKLSSKILQKEFHKWKKNWKRKKNMLESINRPEPLNFTPL